MLSRWDVVLIAAWLASGSLAIENLHRTDLAVPDGRRAQPVLAMVCAPPYPRSSPFALKNPLEATLADITVVCTPG